MMERIKLKNYKKINLELRVKKVPVVDLLVKIT